MYLLVGMHWPDLTAEAISLADLSSLQMKPEFCLDLTSRMILNAVASSTLENGDSGCVLPELILLLFTFE